MLTNIFKKKTKKAYNKSYYKKHRIQLLEKKKIHNRIPRIKKAKQIYDGKYNKTPKRKKSWKKHRKTNKKKTNKDQRKRRKQEKP